MAIIEVIKNEGERELLAWKHPSEELVSWSQLIVKEGEQAVLLASGKQADCFAAGRYTLKTSNLPLLRSLVRIPFGGRSPFTAELWYIKVGETLDIKWGTDAPILLLDGDEQSQVLMRGYGLLGVRVTDAGAFLSSLRGKVDSFSKKALAAYLRSQFCDGVRRSIVSCFNEFGSGFFERSDASKLLADKIMVNVSPITSQYGMEPSCLIVSDLCMTTPDKNREEHLTFSVMSVVIPTAAAPMKAMPVVKPQQRRNPIIAASLIVLLLLLLVFCVMLPPIQTADFIEIAFVTAAHCAVTAIAIWLFTVQRGLLITIGFAVTSAFYWLGAVGAAFVLRLLSIADIGLLSVIELGMAGVAALVLMGFWYGSDHDAMHGDNEVEQDEEE